jgi:hypothetical protein
VGVVPIHAINESRKAIVVLCQKKKKTNLSLKASLYQKYKVVPYQGGSRKKPYQGGLHQKNSTVPNC